MLIPGCGRFARETGDDINKKENADVRCNY